MKKGDKITVARIGFAVRYDGFHGSSLHDTTWFATGVVSSISGGRITYRWSAVTGEIVHDTCATKERGLVWARGHAGREVDALKTTVALGDVP